MPTSRFQPLERLTLSPAQQQVVDRVASGRRGTVPANVVAWLPSPELARRAAHLGEFVRYESSLPPQLSELAILIVARHWSCAYEWAVHAGEAARAGVPAACIEAIRRGEALALTGAEAAVAAVTGELVATGQVSDAPYAEARARLGEAGLTELLAVVGYYTLVAFTLNVRQVPVPPGAPTL